MTVMNFKPKSPLGKQNFRLDRCNQEPFRNGPPSPIAGSNSSFAHTFAKAKRNQDAIEKQMFPQMPMTKHQSQQLNLQCDETLDDFDKSDSRKCFVNAKLQTDLLCEEQLIAPPSNDKSAEDMYFRIQTVLATYRCENQQLTNQKHSLIQQNVRLRSQLSYLMSFYKK